MCKDADPTTCCESDSTCDPTRRLIKMNCGHAVCWTHRQTAYNYNRSTA